MIHLCLEVKDEPNSGIEKTLILLLVDCLQQRDIQKTVFWESQEFNLFVPKHKELKLTAEERTTGVKFVVIVAVVIYSNG